MKNNFQSNGKGRSQRVWQLLISMLIILTMGIGQMWGANIPVAYTYESSASKATMTTNDYFSAASNPAVAGDGVLSANSSMLRCTVTKKKTATVTFTFTAKTAIEVASFTLNSYAGSDKIKSATIDYFKNSATPTNVAVTFDKNSASDKTITPASSIEMAANDVLTIVVNLSNTDTSTDRPWNINTITLNASIAGQLAIDVDGGATKSMVLGAETPIETSVSNASGTETYQWYQTISTDTECASGTVISGAESDSYTPNEGSAGAYYYYCVVTDGLNTAKTELITVNLFSPLTGWVVFDGLIDETARTSPVTYNTVSMTYETSTVTMVDASTKTLDGTTRPYSKLMQISKSTGGYLKFTVPTGYTATFTHAFSGTGSRTIILASAKINSTSAEGYIATLASASSDKIKWGEYTTPLAAGDYYICDCNNGNWQIAELVFTLTGTAVTPVCPDGISISGTTAYTAGETIELEATLTEGNGDITYTWYKGEDLAAAKTAGSIGTGASFTKASCVVGDAGNYFCVASKSECSDEESSAYAVTVAAAATPCYTFTAPLPAEDVIYSVDEVVAGSNGGGKIKVVGTTIKNTAYGLLFASSSSAEVSVTLDHLMKVGTIITVNLWSNNTGSARTLKINNNSGTTKKTCSFTPASASGETKEFTYVVEAGDGFVGANTFKLKRGSDIYLQSMTVSNCGAELFALSSAIDPVAADGKATITLSKTLVAEGATATATYSAIDAAYDFDEWVVSGATIDDAKANPVTITMGSTDATITLKLKAAAVKHKVTYYDNTTKLGEEDINEGSNPTGAGLAPHKLGSTFAGWSTTNDGAATALSGITVNADMSLFAVWNAINCATKSGTIYTMSIAVAPAANCTIKTASGYSATWDLYQYEGVSGGEAMIGNTGSSNNCILQTNKTVLLKDNVSYMKLDFDCPLKEGDTIKTNITGNTTWISTASTRPSGASTALAVLTNSATGKLVVPAALNNATSVYLWKGGGNVTITSIEIVRPVKHSVTFNMNGHGDDVAAQSVVDGAKATEPTPAPTASGYRFVEWQQSGSAYDFDDAVTTDIELDAVWQKTWTVTFNSDGGSDVAAATVDDGQAVAQPANPTKSGFDFVEWRKEGESVAYNFATTVTANITLVAQWEVAQDDASLSALSYNSNAIDVSSAVDVSGVQTYTVHLQYGSTVDASLISVTKNAESADMSAIVYNSENLQATFSVESGNHSVTINYAIQFVIDPKRGTSIIKATTNNVVTGLIGGTIDQSYSGNANSRKLNKGNYFGVTLANDETFQEGDVFIVNITTPADLGKFMIYADKNRTELIADQGIVYTKPNVASPVVCPTGEMMLVLPAAANGKKSLYLSRENVDNSEQWNVTFSYIEVTREMAPVIKSFKFGDEAATINESAKTITYEVAYGTDVTALTPTVEAYGNNGATYTPAGATDFTSPVVYTVTDAYNELHTDYTVTVNIAAPSENANLASLAVAGYSLDFDPAVVTYNVVLDYGTTELPAITYEVEEVGLATANKVEGGVNGATTITVTPQAGAGYEKVYTINFSVNTTPTFKVFDGRTMNAAIVSFTDPTSGMTWTSEDATTSSSSNTKTINGKTYTKSVKIFGSATSASRYLKFTVPADYVAKFYLAGSTNSSTGEATLFFSKELTADPAKAIAGLTASVDDPKWAQTDYQLPGDYYFCVTGSARIYELSVTLYPIDEDRAMTQGRFGTICYPNGGYLVGAMLLEIAYFDPDQKKIFFDEVIGGQMVAGAPYLFLPNEGVDKFAIVYTDNVNALAGHHNGLYGSYTQEALPTDGNHYIMLNNQYCKVVETNTYVGANRAYIKLNKIGNDYVAPAYGRRRVSLGVQQAEVATGLEDLNVGDQPIKIMINGQMYILRGEKMYDATGRLVK